MHKIRTVFRFETIRQLKKPSFWISLLLLPLTLVAFVGLSSINNSGIGDNFQKAAEINQKTLGLTDGTGIFSSVTEDSSAYDFSATFGLKFVKIASSEEGIAKVKSGELDLYYHIPVDFHQTSTIEIYDRARDAGLITNFGAPFSGFLKSYALTQVDPKLLPLLSAQINFTQTNFDDLGQPVNPLGKAIIPIAVLGIFYLLICVFGNRLTMALVEEKENRISEMILTAVSAKHLVIGKILSLIALGFIQVAVIIIPALALLLTYRHHPLITNILAIIEINPFTIITNIILLLVSYFFFAGACTLVGSLVPTAREASQYIAPIMMSIVLPFFFMNSFIISQPTLITYLLTYFPFSAPVAMMLRNAVGNLPPLELLLGTAEIALMSILVLTLTVKSFQKNAINFSVVRPNFKPKKLWHR